MRPPAALHPRLPSPPAIHPSPCPAGPGTCSGVSTRPGMLTGDGHPVAAGLAAALGRLGAAINGNVTQFRAAAQAQAQGLGAQAAEWAASLHRHAGESVAGVPLLAAVSERAGGGMRCGGTQGAASARAACRSPPPTARSPSRRAPPPPPSAPPRPRRSSTWRWPTPRRSSTAWLACQCTRWSTRRTSLCSCPATCAPAAALVAAAAAAVGRGVAGGAGEGQAHAASERGGGPTPLLPPPPPSPLCAGRDRPPAGALFLQPRRG